MGWGFLSAVHKYLGGSPDRPAPDPGFFNPGQVGGMWNDYLKNLYATPTDQSPQFKNLAGGLRDALTQESVTQGQQFGQAANAGGFYDSGARLMGLNQINRNQMMQYSQGLSSILSKLESDKMNAAFPFLQALTGQYNAKENAQHNSQQENDFEHQAIASDVISSMGSSGIGSTGSSTGPQGSYG